MGVLDISDGFPWDIRWASWRFLMGFLEIFDWFPGDFDVCPE